MCTIIVMHRVHPEVPLLVAANRDEFYARPTAPPRVVSEHPRVIAGQDLVSHGTWMGATEHGFFVGITNQRSYDGYDDTLASRGLVALEALRRDGTDAVNAYLAELDPASVNPFNLVYGDHRGVSVAYARRDANRIEVHALPAGTHVLANDRLGSPDFPKTARAEELVRPVRSLPLPAARALLTEALADHRLPPLESIAEPPPGSRFPREIVRELQALCIHTPVYGTRSATLLALGEGRLLAYDYADGPPCTTPFTEVLSRS